MMDIAINKKTLKVEFEVVGEDRKLISVMPVRIVESGYGYQLECEDGELQKMDIEKFNRKYIRVDAKNKWSGR